MRKNLIFALALTSVASCGHKEVAKEATSIYVKTEAVKTINGMSELRYSGTIEAQQTIPLTFMSVGTVTKVLVEEGDAVKKGQLLATVDKSDYQNSYNTVHAKYNQAKDAYNRLKQVHEKGSLSEIKWVEMETNMQQAESQLALIKTNLDRCELRSPEAGIIGRRNIEPGQMSQSGITSSAPFELVKIETVLVKISIPENEIGKIKKGLKAKFSISALNDKIFEGTVTNVGVVADQMSRTYEVKIAVKNQNYEMKPGMVCDVKIALNTESKIITVPNNAITKDKEGNSFVYVVSDDKTTVKKQFVVEGNYRDSGIEIIKGLTDNQIIVVEGKEKLSDNSLIRL